MSILKRLFGGKGDAGGAAESGPAVDYKGFRITPMPAKEASGYRIGARIEKDVDGETRVHDLIRADTIADRQAAEEASVAKARQVIDEQGERVFR